MPTDKRASAPPQFLSFFLGFSFALYAATTLVSMAIMSIGAAVAFVALILSLSNWSTLKRPGTSTYWVLSAALSLACAASLWSGHTFPLPGLGPISVRWTSDLLKLWYFAWAPLLALGLVQLSEIQRVRVWRTWLVTFGILSVVGIFQFWTGWPRPQGIPNLPGHFHSTLFLGHHLSVASIWIFPFFAALSGTFSRAPGGLSDAWKLKRSTFALIALVGGTTLFLGFSRMLWLALPVGVILFGFLQLPERRRIRTGLALVLGAALVSIAIFQIPAVRERLLNSMGTTDRFELWKANLELFRSRPIAGVGWHHNLELAGRLIQSWHPHEAIFTGHAHNNFLDVLGSMGLLGIGCWLLWNGWLWRQLWRLATGKIPSAPWAKELSRGWLAAFFVFHLNGLTQVNFWEGKVQHQLFWVVAWVLYWTWTSRETAEGNSTHV